MSTVSVCISTFNRKDKIRRCIESLIMQSYTDFDIVVVDNASSDGTRDVLLELRSYIGDKLNIVFYASPESNAMKTINRSFRESSGQYILVMDDDAYMIEPNTLSHLVDVMEKNPNASIVGSNVMTPNTGMWQMPIRNIDGEFFTPEEISQLDVVHYFEFHGACALFRRDMVMMANPEGPYDESFIIYMNELDLSTKMLTLGYDVLFDSKAMVYHDGVGDTNACNNRVYHFMHNYNTVLTRNFRGIFKRMKAVTLHTCMSGGYYLERIVFHKTCSLTRIPSYLYLVLKVWIQGMYRSVWPDECHVFENSYKQYVFEESMYNGFKQCIKNRVFWLSKKESGTAKGIR